MPVLRYLTFLLLLSVSLIMGCGESGTGGTGQLSSSASLTLTADKTSVAAGDNVSATVKLTSLTSAPVNGVTVTVDSIYQGIVIGSYSSNTNTSGNAVINIPMTMVASNRTIYLVARSSGITSSSASPLTVVAPVLGSTIPAATSGGATPFSLITFVLGGDVVSFLDGNNIGIPGSVITFTLDSVTGAGGTLEHDNVAIPVGGTFMVTTSSAGTANTAITATILSGADGTDAVTTFYYTLSVTYQGLTFTKPFSSQYTVTATAP